MTTHVARDPDRASPAPGCASPVTVIVRQRPDMAKRFCFLTLEDETGTTNAVVTPARHVR